MHRYIGEKYMTAPAFGSLNAPYLKIEFSFAIPTIVFLGSLDSSVSARFVFFRISPATSPHRTQKTLLGRPMAYLSLHPTKEERWGTMRAKFETSLNHVLILCGIYTLVAGTY
ncbi:hypothetical protein AURDEDRAFT_113434, partial [Auricularia subglabra TFB-10046 SS5]